MPKHPTGKCTRSDGRLAFPGALDLLENGKKFGGFDRVNRAGANRRGQVRKKPARLLDCRLGLSAGDKSYVDEILGNRLKAVVGGNPRLDLLHLALVQGIFPRIDQAASFITPLACLREAHFRKGTNGETLFRTEHSIFEVPEF